MWKVSAQGEDSNKVYVYEVDAPEDAQELEVVCSAYFQHGQHKRSGRVTEGLSTRCTTHWVESIPQ